MKAGPETQRHAVPYLKIFFVSATFFAVYDSGCAVFRAAGNTRTPLVVGSSMILLNLILDPLFIFGIGPFPKLGVPGASVATTISIFLACCLILYKLRRGKAGFPVERLLALKPRISEMLKIARIGLPITIQSLTFIVVYFFLIRIVHQYGEAAGAAMGIGNRMESISYLTCTGFAIAASTMVGQNLGATQPDRASRCAWGAAGIAIAITCLIGTTFIMVPHWIAGIFTSDPEVHSIATDYLIILGLSQFTMATEIVLEGAFSGAGDTLPPMLVLIPGAVLRVPLAYWLCFHLNWGITGVWWTLTMTTTVKASLLALWFRRGKWKLKVV
jgi:putative MATE family efflux protein